MSATLFSITGWNRPANAVGPTRRENFNYAPGITVDARQVIANPNVSLYALDHATREALFVETPPGADVVSHPFLYAAQAQHATRLFAVPYETFLALGDECPRPDQLVIVHSVGRCGSTLLSKLLGGLPDVLSLSEPDVFSQVRDLLFTKRIASAEAKQLLRATTRHCWRPGSREGATCLAIKMRSEVIAVADLLDEQFPASRVVFMYRNAEDVIASFYRLRSPRPVAVEKLKERLEISSAYDGRGPSTERVWAEHGHLGLEVLHWAGIVDHYLRMRDRRDVAAIRYEELLRVPDRVMGELLASWGKQWDPAISRRVMVEDSQRGTSFARSDQKSPLTDDQRRVIRMLLPQVCQVAVPDAILPGTLLVA